ncbi:hypothetical protein MP228_005549 [Amoeboaphelidium protococcarum]|nr:hypothetical protein MP228_005549 [Amoeboaphelidium protococcarum]
MFNFFSIAMVFGPVAPYIPQYRQITKTQNSAGFSTYTVALLLIANILRVFFWIGKRFELTLLWQSVVMILAQLVLQQACVKYAHRAEVLEMQTLDPSSPTKVKRFEHETAFSNLFIHKLMRQFWRWKDFGKYLVFLLQFVIIMLMLQLLFGRSAFYVESVGLVSLVLESLLALPQVINIMATKSSSGLRIETILMWFGGDLFKTVYFFQVSAPVQFLACGVIQLSIDLAIFALMILYSRRQNNEQR